MLGTFVLSFCVKTGLTNLAISFPVDAIFVLKSVDRNEISMYNSVNSKHVFLHRSLFAAMSKRFLFPIASFLPDGLEVFSCTPTTLLFLCRASLLM